MNAQEECDRLSDTVLAEIQLEVDRGNCPSVLQGAISTLLAEVKTLRSQVEILRRLSRRRDSNPGNDTSVI